MRYYGNKGAYGGRMTKRNSRMMWVSPGGQKSRSSPPVGGIGFLRRVPVGYRNAAGSRKQKRFFPGSYLGGYVPSKHYNQQLDLAPAPVYIDGEEYGQVKTFIPFSTIGAATVPRSSVWSKVKDAAGRGLLYACPLTQLIPQGKINGMDTREGSAIKMRGLNVRMEITPTPLFQSAITESGGGEFKMKVMLVKLGVCPNLPPTLVDPGANDAKHPLHPANLALTLSSYLYGTKPHATVPSSILQTVNDGQFVSNTDANGDHVMGGTEFIQPNQLGVGRFYDSEILKTTGAYVRYMKELNFGAYSAGSGQTAARTRFVKINAGPDFVKWEPDQGHPRMNHYYLVMVPKYDNDGKVSVFPEDPSELVVPFNMLANLNVAYAD